MNNLLKSYTFFIKEKYIIFAAGETKAAEFGAVRASSPAAEKNVYFFGELSETLAIGGKNFPECVIKQGSLP